MIKWFCDFCGGEIVNNSVQLVCYLEPINKDLDGYGSSVYITDKKIYLCPQCSKMIDNKLRVLLKGFLKND